MLIYQKAISYYYEIEFYVKHKIGRLGKKRAGNRFKKLSKDIAETINQANQDISEAEQIQILKAAQVKCLEMQNLIHQMRESQYLNDFYLTLFKGNYIAISNKLNESIELMLSTISHRREVLIRHIGLYKPKKYAGKIVHLIQT